MKKTWFGRMARQRTNDERLFFALSGVVFAFACGLLAWFAYAGLFAPRPGEEDANDAAPAAPRCDIRRVLDGACAKAESGVNPRLVAVMIENHVDARPQSGLAKARVVYEAPVEANITRFLAIYSESDVAEKVGPVRSARPYYLDWVAEYGTPMYMHVGGSPDALSRVRASGMFDMDEMTRAWYFWRSDDRFAPHNTYTSNVLWQKALADYGVQYADNEYEGWVFATTTPRQGGERVDTVSVSFDPPWYRAVWEYSSSTGKYFRYQMNEPHADEDGTQIAADTVIVQEARVRVLDSVGRREIETVGSGRARIFMGGVEVEGRWEKSTRTARTQWLDSAGEPIPLAPGTIWVEVVGPEHAVSVQ